MDNDIVISGKVTDDNGRPLSNSDVNISLTGMGYGDFNYTPISKNTTRTDDNGIYKFTYRQDIGGQLNITVNSNDISKNATKSIFIAPQSTVVTMNTSHNQISIGENFTLTGRLTDIDGRILRNTSVGVLINGKYYGDFEYEQISKEYVRTDVNGFYTYVYKPQIAGKLNVCVYYPGYHYYRYNYTQTNISIIPKETMITLDNMPSEINYDDPHWELNISGYLTDDEDNILRNTSVGLLMDNHKVFVYDENSKIYSNVYIKTDNEGKFSYPIKKSVTISPEDNRIKSVFILGNHTFSAYYPGYHNYNYTIESKEIYFKSDTISIKRYYEYGDWEIGIGDTFELRGNVTYDDGRLKPDAVIHVDVEYSANSSSYDYQKIDEFDVKVDSNSEFYIKYKVTKIGSYKFDLSSEGFDLSLNHIVGNQTSDHIVFTNRNDIHNYYINLNTNHVDNYINLSGYVSLTNNSQYQNSFKDAQIRFIVNDGSRDYEDILSSRDFEISEDGHFNCTLICNDYDKVIGYNLTNEDPNDGFPDLESKNTLKTIITVNGLEISKTDKIIFQYSEEYNLRTFSLTF